MEDRIEPIAARFAVCGKLRLGRLNRTPEPTIMEVADLGGVREMIRRVMGAIALAGALAGNANAQQLPRVPFLPYVEPAARPSENALQEAESERVHRQALKNIPDRKVSNDPWRTVRTNTANPTIDRHKVE